MPRFLQSWERQPRGQRPRRAPGSRKVVLPERAARAVREREQAEERDKQAAAERRARVERKAREIKAEKQRREQAEREERVARIAEQETFEMQDAARNLGVQMTTTAAVPEPVAPRAVLQLTPGRLSCPSCGQQVRDDDDATGEKVTVTHLDDGLRPGMMQVSGPARPVRETEVTYRRCPECERRHDLAVRALSALPPSARHRLGAIDAATERIATALDGLAAAGLRVPGTLKSADVLALVERVAVGAVRWQVNPAASSGQTATVVPWGHVTDEIRAAVRRGWAAVLADRLDRAAPPVPLTPPAGRACAFCGRAAVPVTAQRVRARGGRLRASDTVWHPHAINPRALGGKPSPEPTPAYLCPACHAAVERAGAMGPTAVETAYREHQRASGEPSAPLGAPSPARAWIITSAEPSATPWAHVQTSTDDGPLDPSTLAALLLAEEPS